MGKHKRASPDRLPEKLLAVRLSFNLSRTEMLKEIRPELDSSLRGSFIGDFRASAAQPVAAGNSGIRPARKDFCRAAP